MDDYRPISLPSFIYPKDLNPTELEEEFMALIESICQDERLHFERRSVNYISAIIGYNDFLYFKLTDKTKWFKLRVANYLRNEYIDSPLFPEDKEKKKKVLMWKVNISDLKEIDAYKQVIKESCREW